MNPHLPNPDCEKDCRFQFGVSMRTAMDFPPIYDKHGNNLNPDGNITYTTISCTVCGESWRASTQYGKTTYESNK